MGRLGELLEEATSVGLDVFLHPSSYRGCDCPDCRARGPAWYVEVLGMAYSEDLSWGRTLAEAVEFSFLPLQITIETGLEWESLPICGEQTPREPLTQLELGRLDELVAEIARLGVGLAISPPLDFYAYGPLWCVLMETRDAITPLGYGDTLAEAVAHAFLPLQLFAQEDSP
jgi:hypothetical protein